MSELKAVKAPEADPKAGKPRKTSNVEFPYYDLEQCIALADVMHRQAGGECDRQQLAAFLGHKSTKNGAFMSKVSAAKLFGLIEQDGNTLRVTRRGSAIVAQVSDTEAAQAKVDAFLDVELFDKIYAQYRESQLPEEVGLKNLLKTQYGVIENRLVPTVRILIDSAEYAGFFRASGNRRQMVRPVIAKQSPQETPLPKASDDAEPPRKGGGGSSGGGGGSGPTLNGVHPAIVGLLAELPPAGTAMTQKRRDRLIGAFTATVAFIYPDAEVEQEDGQD